LSLLFDVPFGCRLEPASFVDRSLHALILSTAELQSNA
jgi:hypothetical protein